MNQASSSLMRLPPGGDFTIRVTDSGDQFTIAAGAKVDTDLASWLPRTRMKTDVVFCVTINSLIQLLHDRLVLTVGGSKMINSFPFGSVTVALERVWLDSFELKYIWGHTAHDRPIWELSKWFLFLSLPRSADDDRLLEALIFYYFLADQIHLQGPVAPFTQTLLFDPVRSGSISFKSILS